MNNAFTPLPVEPIPRTSLRPNEAAESLGISQRKLQYLMRDDATFPRVKAGGTVLIPIAELRIWLAGQATKRGAA